MAMLTSTSVLQAQTLDLDTAVEMALNNNLSIKIAQKDKEKAEMGLRAVPVDEISKKSAMEQVLVELYLTKEFHKI